MLLNCGQLLYIIFLLRPIYFDPVLEDAFERVFKPMAVTRLQFKKLVTAGDSAQVVRLHSGECYAVENMTKTDRLALLISGRAVVLTEKRFLHHVDPFEFMDSPEFEGCNLGLSPIPRSKAGPDTGNTCRRLRHRYSIEGRPTHLKYL